MLGNKIEKQFVNGLQAGLTNTLSNNIDENKYQLFDTSQFILHKQLYGWDQMRNKDLLQTARTTLATAKLTLRDIISDQMTEVSTNFRTALHEEESLYTMQGALQTSQSNITKSKQQYATGFISQNDLDNIMLQEVNTQLNIESQTLRLNEGINRLKLKIGLSSADTIKLLPDLSQQPAIDTLVKKMPSTRPTAEHQHLCDTIRYSRDLISARFTIDALNRQLAIQNRENPLV